jgi:hypothetical protein
MTIEKLKDYVKDSFEIELTYQGKKYSVTYYNDKRKDYISFCEFYQDTLDVPDVETLWGSTYHGIKVSNIFESLGDNDYSLF